ncbi:TraV family lipoprotein [Sphingobium lactosutens]|uniref:TraV family lipoprotein n=1 Tax=Sphingobium lactosutens TaxID=522773 RepID=UPI002118A0EC|nr:TraV family lipoprotein [Sphingobium lactosutens]
MMSPNKPRPFSWPQALVGLFAITTLSGCVGLSGNIKGNFACQAPDGICAPSAVIDDRALRLISEDPSATPAPAGTYRPEGKPPTAKSTSAARVAVVQPVRGPVSTTPGRSNERVLRIVFPAHIDARGRLHEASAVHAVVSQGEWLTSTDDNAAPTRTAMSAAPDMPSLAEAVASKEAAPLEVDPNLPDPAVVAAARARKADPVAAIKAEVAGRLRPSPRSATDDVAPSTGGQSTISAAEQPTTAAVRTTVQAASFPAAVGEDN